MPIRSTARSTVRSTFKFALTGPLALLIAIAPIANNGGLQLAAAQQNTRALVLGADFHPTHEQLETLKRRFPRTTEEKIFFHWTKPEIGLRWIQQGHIDSGEVEFYNTPTNDRQAYGAGVYMASNPTSSEGFGEFCVVFKMAAGTPLYSAEIVKEVFGRDLTDDEKTALGKQVPFIRDLNGGDWHLTHSASNLTRIEYAGPYGGDAHMFRGSDQKTMLAAIEKAKAYGDTGYLESFFHLMHYMDGISLQRAIRVAPSNPWSQFEPSLFENFRKMNQATLELKPVNSEITTWGPDEKDRDRWVETQLKSTLPGLINGLYNSQGANFRGHGIRAGGTSENRTFVATPQDLFQLLKNPYLKVDYRPDGSGQGFLVSYHYPSIQTLAHLKPLVSADVYESLSRYSPQQIQADHALEVRLNQTLITDLVRNLLSDVHGKQIDTADFLQRYISIHPYSDGNGRSGRLFLQKHLNLVGKSLPPFYISDLDLLVSKPTLAKIIEASDKAYLALQKAMLGEFIASGFGKKRMPDYFKLKQFDQLLTSLSVFGFQSTDRVDARFDHDVFERRFNEIFSTSKGMAWSLIPDEHLQETLEFARKNRATGYLKALGQKTAALIQGLKTTPNLAADNEFLKNMMTFGGALKELPSLKRAYMQKITQIVRKLDYTKPEHFELLEQYKAFVPVAQQRETLGFIARGFQKRAEAADTDWTLYQKRSEFRLHYQTSEMKFLITSLLDGSMKAAEFSKRMSRLDENALSPANIEITVERLPAVLKLLSWSEKTQVLKRLDLTSLPIDDSLMTVFSDLVEPLKGMNETEATEYRTVLANALTSQFHRTKFSEPQGRLLYDLWLHTSPNVRYGLTDVAYHAGDIVYQRMIEVLKEDVLGKKTLTPEQAMSLIGYVTVLASANKRMPLDTKSWIAFLKPHVDQLESIGSNLRPIHFKSTLYYALLEVLRENQNAKLQLFTGISSNYEKVAGGEQLRIELLKDAKRTLTPENYVAVASSYLYPANTHGFDKLTKKAAGLVLRPVFAEFAKQKPDFNAHASILLQHSNAWSRFTDTQILTILKDQTLLQQILESGSALKMSSHQVALLKQAIAAQSESSVQQTLKASLRTGLKSFFGEAQYMKRKRELIQALFEELKALGAISATEALDILQAVPADLSPNAKSSLISSVKRAYLRDAAHAASGKMTASEKSEFSSRNWLAALTSASFSPSEKRLISEATKKADAMAILSYIYAAPATASLFKSDYMQAAYGALPTLTKAAQESVLMSVIQTLISRTQGLEHNERGAGLKDLRENMVYLFAAMPQVNEAMFVRVAKAVAQSYATYGEEYTSITGFMATEPEKSRFKTEVSDVRYGRLGSKPKTCQAVFGLAG